MSKDLFDSQTMVRFYFNTNGFNDIDLLNIKPVIFNKKAQTKVKPIADKETVVIIPSKKSKTTIHEVESMKKTTPTEDEITVINDSTTAETVAEFMKEVAKENADLQPILVNPEVIEVLEKESEYDEELSIRQVDNKETEEIHLNESINEETANEEKEFNEAIDDFGHLIYSYLDNKEVHKLFSKPSTINKSKFYEALKKTTLESINFFMLRYGLNDNEEKIHFVPNQYDGEHYEYMKRVIIRIHKIDVSVGQLEKINQIEETKKTSKLFYDDPTLLAKQFSHIWDQYAKRFMSPFAYAKIKIANKEKLLAFVSDLIV